MVTDDSYKYNVRNAIPNNWTILTDGCDKYILNNENQVKQYYDASSIV